MPSAVQEQQERRDALADLLGKRPLRNQSEAVRLLRDMGFTVTQSSVSRDLKELGAVKQNGRYTLPASADTDDISNPELAALAVLLTAVQSAGPNLVVVRTTPGGASFVARVVDARRSPNVVGSVAGDDTVFLAVPDGSAQKRVINHLERLRDEARSLGIQA